MRRVALRIFDLTPAKSARYLLAVDCNYVGSTLQYGTDNLNTHAAGCTGNCSANESYSCIRGRPATGQPIAVIRYVPIIVRLSSVKRSLAVISFGGTGCPCAVASDEVSVAIMMSKDL